MESSPSKFASQVNALRVSHFSTTIPILEIALLCKATGNWRWAFSLFQT